MASILLLMKILQGMMSSPADNDVCCIASFVAYGFHYFYPFYDYREIMQLFSVGLNLLNIDGTDKLDDDGNPIETYTNDEIMSMARVFTGFVRQAPRGNYEEEWDRRNMLDHMTIVPSYHDMFPKSDLTGGYIGDGYPLCVDLPSKMFIRKGATYKLLGDSPSPQAFEDPSSFNSDPTVIHFVLDENSLLREKLCNSVGGKCEYIYRECAMFSTLKSDCLSI